MAEGAGKVTALAALEAVKTEMQGFQVKYDAFKTANEAYKSADEDKKAEAIA